VDWDVTKADEASATVGQFYHALVTALAIHDEYNLPTLMKVYVSLQRLAGVVDVILVITSRVLAERSAVDAVRDDLS
jgi:hypothetical protein